MMYKANKQYGTHRFWIGKETLAAAKARKELQALTENMGTFNELTEEKPASSLKRK